MNIHWALEKILDLVVIHCSQIRANYEIRKNLKSDRAQCYNKIKGFKRENSQEIISKCGEIIKVAIKNGSYIKQRK